MIECKIASNITHLMKRNTKELCGIHFLLTCLNPPITETLLVNDYRVPRWKHIDRHSANRRNTRNSICYMAYAGPDIVCSKLLPVLPRETRDRRNS